MAGYSSEELSSDEELQEEFAKGNLQSGLIVRAPPVKICTNNVSGMKEILAELKKNQLEWLERMDVTATALESKPEETNEEGNVDPEDDFKREMLFYQQAQSSAPIGLLKLKELNIPCQRPKDYYAEMVKTDDHMRKIRENLLSRQKVLEQKEKSKKLREQKKYGKKVQHEVLQKRRLEKKTAMEAVKKFKKGKGERPSFLGGAGEEDSFPVTTESLKKSAQQSGGKKGVMDISKKKSIKDKKFGFGGKKRWSKSNTAESSADMSSFNASTHSRKTQRPGVGGARGKKGKGNKNTTKTVRLGKSRRQKLKMK